MPVKAEVLGILCISMCVFFQSTKLSLKKPIKAKCFPVVKLYRSIMKPGLNIFYVLSHFN